MTCERDALCTAVLVGGQRHRCGAATFPVSCAKVLTALGVLSMLLAKCPYMMFRFKSIKAAGPLPGPGEAIAQGG